MIAVPLATEYARKTVEGIKAVRKGYPRAGRTCANCDAPCCYRIVGYRAPGDRQAKDALSKAITLYSHNELLALGLFEATCPLGDKCFFLEAGRCSKEHHKPRLCRTYWCHGRYWIPRGTQNE